MELPEPSSILGLAMGLAFFATIGRRRMRLCVPEWRSRC